MAVLTSGLTPKAKPPTSPAWTYDTSVLMGLPAPILSHPEFVLRTEQDRFFKNNSQMEPLSCAQSNTNSIQMYQKFTELYEGLLTIIHYRVFPDLPTDEFSYHAPFCSFLLTGPVHAAPCSDELAGQSQLSHLCTGHSFCPKPFSQRITRPQYFSKVLCKHPTFRRKAPQHVSAVALASALFLIPVLLNHFKKLLPLVN